jgi:hypothetical protein
MKTNQIKDDLIECAKMARNLAETCNAYAVSFPLLSPAEIGELIAWSQSSGVGLRGLVHGVRIQLAALDRAMELMSDELLKRAKEIARDGEKPPSKT